MQVVHAQMLTCAQAVFKAGVSQNSRVQTDKYKRAFTDTVILFNLASSVYDQAEQKLTIYRVQFGASKGSESLGTVINVYRLLLLC